MVRLARGRRERQTTLQCRQSPSPNPNAENLKTIRSSDNRLPEGAGDGLARAQPKVPACPHPGDLVTMTQAVLVVPRLCQRSQSCLRIARRSLLDASTLGRPRVGAQGTCDKRKHTDQTTDSFFWTSGTAYTTILAFLLATSGTAKRPNSAALLLPLVAVLGPRRKTDLRIMF